MPQGACDQQVKSARDVLDVCPETDRTDTHRRASGPRGGERQAVDSYRRSLDRRGRPSRNRCVSADSLRMAGGGGVALRSGRPGEQEQERQERSDRRAAAPSSVRPRYDVPTLITTMAPAHRHPPSSGGRSARRASVHRLGTRSNSASKRTSAGSSSAIGRRYSPSRVRRHHAGSPSPGRVNA